MCEISLSQSGFEGQYICIDWLMTTYPIFCKSSSFSIGTATLVGYGLLNYR